MKSHARRGSWFFVIALGAGWLIVGGCGGRSLLEPKPDGGGAGQGSGAAGNEGSAGTAGATGAAGSTSGAAGATGAAGSQTGTAGSPGVAGSGTGTAGTTGTAGSTSGSGGTTGAGGSAACGPCPNPNCKMGFMSVVDPTVSCCPVCRPINCATVDCAAPPCPNGHLETPDGQCCPVCVAGPPLACLKGQKDYVVQRAQLLDKYGSAPCMVDKDCALFFEKNQCQVGCGVAIATSLLDNLRTNLNGPASMECNTCPPPPVPPCAQFVALCSNGLCVAGSPPLK